MLAWASDAAERRYLIGTASFDSSCLLSYTSRASRVRVKPAILAVVCAVALQAPAAAHHSFVVEYDANRPLKLAGVVAKFEWVNPHAFLYLDVVEPGGARTTWTFEMASPNVLEVNGWTRRTLKTGDRVRLEGYGSFAMVTRGMVSSITTMDGRALVAGEGPLTPDGQ